MDYSIVLSKISPSPISSALNSFTPFIYLGKFLVQLSGTGIVYKQRFLNSNTLSMMTKNVISKPVFIYLHNIHPSRDPLFRGRSLSLYHLLSRYIPLAIPWVGDWIYLCLEDSLVLEEAGEVVEDREDDEDRDVQEPIQQVALNQ